MKKIFLILSIIYCSEMHSGQREVIAHKFTFTPTLWFASSQTLYLEASGSYWGVPGKFASWTDTTLAILRPCYPAGFQQRTTIASTTLAVNNSSSTASTSFAQFVSPALSAQTISGSVTGYARLSVSNATGCTAQSRCGITVIDRYGNIKATLVGVTAGASNLTTTLTSYQILNSATITSYACADGDRLCVEFGIGRSSGTTSRNGTVSLGSSSATNISAAGSTSADNPTLVFNNPITYYSGVKY